MAHNEVWKLVYDFAFPQKPGGFWKSICAFLPVLGHQLSAPFSWSWPRQQEVHLCFTSCWPCWYHRLVLLLLVLLWLWKGVHSLVTGSPAFSGWRRVAKCESFHLVPLAAGWGFPCTMQGAAECCCLRVCAALCSHNTRKHFCIG